MKKHLLPLLLIASLVSLQGCSAIQGIFKAGMWVGVLAVVFIVGLVIWLFTRLKK
ncbi:MAG: phosphatidate cytidylyltransferase [Chitinophagaceae bacterium]